MVEVKNSEKRIAYDDLFDLYEGKYVILGHVEEDEWGNVISGIPVLIAERNERNAVFDQYFRYVEEKKHGKLCYNYFGHVETIGVYL